MTPLAELLQQTQAELEQAKSRIAALETQLTQSHSQSSLDQRIFRYIAEYSWDVFALVSERGAIEYISPTIQQITGYSVAEFARMDLRNIVHLDDIVTYRSILQELLVANGQRHTFDLQVRHKDGHWICIEVAAINYLNNPDLHAILFNGRDITAQKAAQHEWQVTTERYRSISDLMSDYAFSYRVDADGQIVREWVTGSYTHITGYSLDDPHPDGLYGLYAPEERERVKADIEATKSGKTVTAEYRIITQQGEERWLHIIRKPVWDEQGQRVVRFYGGAQDITQRKKTEKALADSESHYRHIVEDQIDLVCRYDKDLKITFGNRAYCKARGMTPQTIIGSSILEKIPPEDHQQARAYINSLNKDNPVSISVHQSIQVDQSLRWFEWKDRAILDENGDVLEYQGIGRDVTDQKRVEEALRVNEERYRSLIESSDATISLVDASGKYLYLNHFAAAPFGTTPDALMGKTVYDLFLPDQARSILSDVQKVIQTNQGVILEPEVTLNGKSCWFRTSMQPVRDSHGKPYAVLIHANETTEKRLAEQATYSQNQILHQSHDLIALSDTTGKITYINNWGAALMGVGAPEQMLGKSIPHFHLPEDADYILNNAIPVAVKTGQWRGENRLKTFDGRLVDIDQTVFPIKDEKGMVTHYATIMTDISERKKTEAALSQSESYLRSLVDSQTAFNVRVDMNGNFSYCNKRYSEQFSWLSSSLIGRSSLEMVIPEDQHKVVEAVTQCMEHVGTLVRLELRKPAQDGSHLWTMWEFIAVQDSDGTVKEIQCVGFDVTKQKLAEAELRAVNESLEQRVTERTAELEKVKNRIEAIFNHSGDGILLLDITQGIQQANHAFDTLFNLVDQDYVEKPLTTLVRPEYAAQIEATIRDVVATHQKRQIEALVERTDGTQFDAEFSIAPVNRSENAVTNLVCIIRDVSERKRADQALRESQNMLYNVIENIPIRILWTDENSVYRGCNTLHARSLGLNNPAEIVGKSAADFGHENTADWEADDRRVMETGQGKYNIEEIFPDVDGVHRWIHFNKIALRDTHGKATGVLITIEDITARKDAEIAVSEERNLLRTLIDAVPDFIYVKDTQHRMLLNNNAHTHLLGFETPDQVIGKTDSELYPDRISNTFITDEVEIIQTGKSLINSEERTINLTGGNEIWVQTTKVPLRNLQGEIIGLVGITHDISRIKATEAALREAQKMLQLVLDTIPVRVFWKDRDSLLLGCNRLFAQDAGFEIAEELVSRERSGHKAITPNEDDYRADDLAVMQTGIPKLDYEEPFSLPNGQILSLQSSKLPLKNEQGETIGILGTYTDITARKLAETALEQKYREEIEMQTYLKALHGTTLQLTRTETLDSFYRCAVEQGMKLFGFERMGLLLYDPSDQSAIGTYGTDDTGKIVDEHHIRLNPSSLTGILKRTLDRAERFAFDEDAQLFANFKYVGMGQNAVAALWNGDILGWIAIDNAVNHKPITKAQLDILALYALTAGSLLARKRAEFALREGEERYRLLAENVNDVIIKLSANTEITFITPSCYSAIGYTPQELIGLQGFDIVHPDDRDASLEVVAKAMQSGASSFTLIERIRHKDGHYVWAEVANTTIYDPVTKMPIEMIGVIRDITGRRKAEEDLRNSEERLRILFETAPDVICLLNLKGDFVDVNPAGLKLLGLSRDQIIGQNVMALNLFNNPIYNAQTVEGLAITQSGGARTTEYELVGKNGTPIYIESASHPIVVNNEQLQLAIIRDITDRRLAEQALRVSEENYRTLITTMSEGIVLQGHDGDIRTCNTAAERMLGLTADQMMGRSSTDPRWRAIHEDGSPFPGETHPAMVTLRTGQPQSNVVMGVHKSDDSLTWISINSRPVMKSDQEQPDAVVCTFSDITQRLMAEKTLQKKLEEEQALQQYLQALHETTIKLTQLTTLDDFYQSVIILGLKRLGFDRMGLFLYDESRNMATGTYGTDIQGNLQSEYHIQFVISPKGGLWASLQKPNRFYFAEEADLEHNRTVVGTGWNVSVALWYGEHNLGWLVADNLINHQPASKLQLEILGQYGIYIAASLARRQAEESLQKTKDQLQAILDYSTSSIFMKDLDGHIMILNRTAEADFDLTPNEWIGKRESELFHKETADYYQITDEKVIETRVPISYEEPFKGHTNWVTKFPIFDHNDQIYAIGGIATDMSERKRYEESLERALKKEQELGELKSRFVSIASHEFRTPLATILASTETLAAYRGRMTPVQIDDRLDRIHQQVMHMKSIMEDVLQLSRIQAGKVEYKPTNGDLDVLCREIIDEFESQTQYQGRIHYEALTVPLLIYFDVRLMRQIISNLISNALKYSLNDKPIDVNLAQENDNIVLKVRDQGIGIPDDDLQHLFEPFHRASNVGTISGTGLGLSITKQAVEMHGGTIIPISKVDVGTTFVVTLPHSTTAFPSSG